MPTSTRFRTRFGLTMAVALCAAAATAQTWPGFGGPTRHFHTEAAWTSEPRELWRRDLGFGNSGLAISEEAVFVQYRAYENGKPSDRESIAALRRDDGETLWSIDYDSRARAGQEDYGGGLGPHATPIIHDGLLVALAYDGQVRCLRAQTGDVVWQLDLVEDFGARPVQFGFSASPLVLTRPDGGPTVLLQAAGERGGLHAFELATGRHVWSSKRVAFSYASPFLLEREGGDSWLVFPAGNEVQGLDPATGDLLWEHTLAEAGLTNIPTPLPLPGLRLALSGQGVKGSRLLELADGSEGPSVVASWKSPRRIEYGNWVVTGNLLVGGDGVLFGLDVSTGKRLWAERGFDDANLVVLGNGDLAVQTKDGRLRHLKVDAKGVEVLHELQIFDHESWTPPAFAGEVLYARSRRQVVALSVTDP